MLLALFLPWWAAAASAAPAPSTVVPAGPGHPLVQITLQGDRVYGRGDQVKVRIKAADDGYLVVLRATTQGRIRLLFPLDPGDDNFLRGGKTYEVRGRGGREAFTADDDQGTGTIFAAVSSDPFHFDDFIRGDHWDYQALAATRVSGDAEPELVDLVQRMASGTRFQYDLVTYQVEPQTVYSHASGYYGPIYRPYYDPFDDPFYGDCFGCPGYYGSGLRVSVIFGARRRAYYYPPAFYSSYYYFYPYYDPYFYSYRPIYRYRSYQYPSYVFDRHYPRYSPYTFKSGFQPGTPAGYRPRSLSGGTAGSSPWTQRVTPAPRVLDTGGPRRDGQASPAPQPERQPPSRRRTTDDGASTAGPSRAEPAPRPVEADGRRARPEERPAERPRGEPRQAPPAREQPREADRGGRDGSRGSAPAPRSEGGGGGGHQESGRRRPR